MRESQSQKFCNCIKAVIRKSRKPLSENIAIPICVKSVLQTRGRTLRRFKCGKKPRVITQTVRNRRK
jgi:hypothetical protein